MKARLPLTILLLGSLLALAGCGGGGGGGGSSSPAALAPPGAPVFIEGTIRPQGQLEADLQEVVRTIAGIDDLGEEIVSELEESAREEGEPFDFEREVQPWLGERAGVFLDGFDGEDFQRFGVAIETTDPDATQEFIDKQTEADEDPIDDASYEGVDYKVDRADETVVGVVDEFLVVSEKEEAFKDAVEAANGDSLEDEAAYDDAIANATEGSLADLYVDVGLLIEQSGDEIDEGALKAFESAGIEPREATAVASIIPGGDRVELEISSEAGGQEPPSGDVSELLGSVDGEAFAALAFSGFGEQLQEGVDELDKEGVPGEIPPNQLKKGLKQTGIDLEGFAGSLEDAALFATGSSEKSLEVALVLTTDGSGEASETIANVQQLLEATGQDVTPVEGEAAGFELRSSDLGDKPLVVVSEGERVAIGYGSVPALRSLAPSQGGTLADEPAFDDAVAALGETPISAFIDGPEALRLAESFASPDDEDFQEAKPYLRKIASIAIGSASEGDRATAKVIALLEK